MRGRSRYPRGLAAPWRRWMYQVTTVEKRGRYIRNWHKQRAKRCPHPPERYWCHETHWGERLTTWCRDCGKVLTVDHGWGARSRKYAKWCREEDKKRAKAQKGSGK